MGGEDKPIGGVGPLRILLVGGWSPGPLNLLHFAMSNQDGGVPFPDGTYRRRRKVDFIDARIPTPPVGLRWLMNKWLVLVLFWISATYWLVENVMKPSWKEYKLVSERAGEWRLSLILWIVIPAVSILVSGRYAVAMVVRESLRQGMEKVVAQIHHGVDAIAAFSWGGAVVCWVLAEYPELCKRLPMLIMAPTITYISNAAALPFPTFTTGLQTRIILADEDPFCPLTQNLLLEKTGAQVHAGLDGGHIFSDADAQALIIKLYDQICIACPDPPTKKM